MNIVVLTADLRMAEKVELAMRLRWPDAVTSIALDAQQCREQLSETQADVLFLDATHPGINVSDLLLEIRRQDELPILVMSEGYGSLEAAQALELGADDYLASSAEPLELVARVVAVRRRQALSAPQSSKTVALVSADLVVDPRTYEARLGDTRLRLTSTEFRLLSLLMNNRESVVTHEGIEDHLWGRNANAVDLVKKYVQRLRWKLLDDPRDPKWIASVHGVGYRFIGPGAGQTEDRPVVAGSLP